jgi:hypothetical protein
MSRIEWRVDAGTHIVLRKPLFLRRKVELNGWRMAGNWRKKRFTFLLADGRSAQIHRKADAFSRQTELSIDGKVIPDTRYVPKDLRCPACKAEIQLLDEYCTACGKALGTPDRFLKQRSVRGAATAIRILAILFAAYGALVYFGLNDTTQKAIENLAQYEDHELLETADGSTYTTSELRAQIIWRHRLVLVVNLILSGIMVVLAWWSKRKPLAAILIATAVFAVLQVVGAIIDPQSIMRGIIFKLIIVGVLIRGIKGAFDLRGSLG